MKLRWLVAAAALVAFPAVAAAQENGGQDNGGTVAAMARTKAAKIIPGRSNKTDVRSLLGAPWRVVQFNDCGMAMDDQADETWEYRGADQSGAYRVHIEFDDNNVVHLIAKIPDSMPGGKATAAKMAPSQSRGMSM